jgi:hypothetical protein
MGYSCKRLVLAGISAAIVGVSLAWAVPEEGAALLLSHRTHPSRPAPSAHATPRASVSGKFNVPFPAKFRSTNERGLLVDVWVDDRGPYTFAIDTGAGATLVSGRLAQEGSFLIRNNRVTNIGGLSGVAVVAGREASLRSLSIGDRSNYLPAKGLVMVTDRLPPDIDGVLDPTECFWPLGYVIDMTNNEVSAFDAHASPLRRDDVPPGGAVVRWVFDGESRRPFVMLDNGNVALLDTGSRFGLALNQSAARRLGVAINEGDARDNTRDLAGGTVWSRRMRPATVHVGSLTLLRVPTDLLVGVDARAPILLGRDALRPFRVAFDPANRLIQFAPDKVQ